MREERKDEESHDLTGSDLYSLRNQSSALPCGKVRSHLANSITPHSSCFSGRATSPRLHLDVSCLLNRTLPISQRRKGLQTRERTRPRRERAACRWPFDLGAKPFPNSVRLIVPRLLWITPFELVLPLNPRLSVIVFRCSSEIRPYSLRTEQRSTSRRRLGCTASSTSWDNWSERCSVRLGSPSAAPRTMAGSSFGRLAGN